MCAVGTSANPTLAGLQVSLSRHFRTRCLFWLDDDRTPLHFFVALGPLLSIVQLPAVCVTRLSLTDLTFSLRDEYVIPALHSVLDGLMMALWRLRSIGIVSMPTDREMQYVSDGWHQRCSPTNLRRKMFRIQIVEIVR